MLNFFIPFIFLFSLCAFAKIPSLENSQQIILVVAKSESDFSAEVKLFSFLEGKWSEESSYPAVIGRSGLGTGRGLPAPLSLKQKKDKKEGDGKSPAGIFKLGKVYGKAEKLPFASDFVYQQITASLVGVDDGDSVYYNQIVDAATVKKDWKSFEDLIKVDGYKWLMEIAHNPENVPGAGSLIFLHVWRNADSGTAGCTALSEENLLKVLNWLKKDANPRLVAISLAQLNSFLAELRN